MIKHIIRLTSTEAAIRHQKQVQKQAELTRIEREQAYDAEQLKKRNRILARAYPPMVDYYSSAGSFLISLLKLLYLAMGGIFIYFIGLSIYENGFLYTLNDLNELRQ